MRKIGVVSALKEMSHSPRQEAENRSGSDIETLS
jgi:hypothetical protein